jgi:hypothetical protein
MLTLLKADFSEMQIFYHLFVNVQKDPTSEADSFDIGRKVVEKLPFCKPAFHHSSSTMAEKVPFAPIPTAHAQWNQKQTEHGQQTCTKKDGQAVISQYKYLMKAQMSAMDRKGDFSAEKVSFQRTHNLLEFWSWLFLSGHKLSPQWRPTLQRISDFVFPEIKPCGFSPNFHFHKSESDLYIPTISPSIFLQQDRRTDPGNI